MKAFFPLICLKFLKCIEVRFFSNPETAKSLSWSYGWIDAFNYITGYQALVFKKQNALGWIRAKHFPAWFGVL